MFQAAGGFRVDVVDERFVIDAFHRGARWEVIVEPDPLDSLLVVITAYQVSRE